MQAGRGVRAAVEAVEREFGQLAKRASVDDQASLSGLRAAWSNLVGVLALGPRPELRECPQCGSVCMRAATRCGNCWRKLAPPRDAAAQPSSQAGAP
jgi:hypothetical protein